MNNDFVILCLFFLIFLQICIKKGWGICTDSRISQRRQPAFSSLWSSEYLNTSSSLVRGNGAYANCPSHSVTQIWFLNLLPSFRQSWQQAWSPKDRILTNFMAIWQVSRRKESKLAPPLRETAAITCSRRQQPDGQAEETSLHTRNQLSLPPAKLFGDTGGLWGYWSRVCRGHRTQTQPGFTGSAVRGTAWYEQGNGISEKTEEEKVWTAWHPCPWDSLSPFLTNSRCLFEICLLYSVSGKKEILMLPMSPEPHKDGAINHKERFYSLAVFFPPAQ